MHKGSSRPGTGGDNAGVDLGPERGHCLAQATSAAWGEALREAP